MVMQDLDRVRIPRAELADMFPNNPRAQRSYELVTMAVPQTASDTVTAQSAADTARAAAAAAQATADGKQPLDATLTALAALSAAAGLLEQTGADAFTKRAIGVGAASSIPTRDDADGRYVRQDQGAAWTAATGTASRATFATYAAPVAAAAYDPLQMQALMDHVQALSQHVKALIDDLTANGALNS